MQLTNLQNPRSDPKALDNLDRPFGFVRVDQSQVERVLRWKICLKVRCQCEDSLCIQSTLGYSFWNFPYCYQLPAGCPRICPECPQCSGIAAYARFGGQAVTTQLPHTSK